MSAIFLYSCVVPVPFAGSSVDNVAVADVEDGVEERADQELVDVDPAASYSWSRRQVRD